MNNPFEAIDARLSNIENLLNDLRLSQSTSTSSGNTDELLTVPDVAKFLRLSVPTVYSLISKGELPVMKRSKRCYFTKADLIEYLKAGRKRTYAEITSDPGLTLKSRKD